MLSTTNGSILKSHLFIAITNDDLRGKYTCMSSDEPDVTLQAFIIESKRVHQLHSFLIRILFFRSRLNTLILLPILG